MLQYYSISKNWERKENKGSAKVYPETWLAIIKFKTVKKYCHDALKGGEVWGMYKPFELNSKLQLIKTNHFCFCFNKQQNNYGQYSTKQNNKLASPKWIICCIQQ